MTAAALVEALQRLPRRFVMPPLPPGADAAAAIGSDASLAWAIEQRRLALQQGLPAPAHAATAFVDALATTIAKAVDAQRGDPAFQATLARQGSPTVQAYLQRKGQAAADRRAVMASVNRLAHPARLSGLPPAVQQARRALHRLAQSQDWQGLRAALTGQADPSAAWHDLAGHPGLQRLGEWQALRARPEVQCFVQLAARAGPAAGSEAALQQGHAAGRRGEASEQRAHQALVQCVERLNHRSRDTEHRVVRGLKCPAGFTDSGSQAKQEWDLALLRRQRNEPAWCLVALVEVKSAPEAAEADWPRLLRGLQRLAQARADEVMRWPSADGAVDLKGNSLRGVLPEGQQLPLQVFYACAATQARPPAWISARAKAVLLSHPASLAHGLRLQAGEAADREGLRQVWQALEDAGPLRGALHQYEVASLVRAAMLHPDDVAACAPPG